MDNDNSQKAYNGTWTLKNKLNISDSKELARVDRLMSRSRARSGMPYGRFDKNHLQKIHQHLFQDVYEWAGKLREDDLWKENTHFVDPKHTDNALDSIFNLLKESDHLKGLNQYEFTEKASRYYSRINEVQPFREGNGRVQRAFFSQMAYEAGYKIDWSKFELEQWKEANQEATRGNDKPMLELFRKATQEIEITPKQKTRALTSAYLKLPKEQATRLYPELNELYSAQKSITQFARDKLGRDHQKIPSMVNRIIAESLNDLGHGKNNVLNKVRSHGIEMEV